VMEKVNGVSVGEAQRLGLSSRDRVDVRGSFERPFHDPFWFTEDV